MLSQRSLAWAASRAAQAARAQVAKIPQRRFQSSGTAASKSTSSPNGSGLSHIASGVAGGVAGAAVLYGVYTMTPSGRMTSKINKAAQEVDTKYRQAAATLKDKAPSTDEAVGRLKEFCYSYVGWIPGGRQYVDSAFNDFASIREHHGDEVDKLVADTYKKIQDVAMSGFSMESASKAYDALADLALKLGKLASSAGDQILQNHPQLKENLGEPIDQLKQMGDKYGPDAKKMVDETWDQIRDVLAGGFSADSVDKVRRLLDEKSQQLRKFGDQAWEKCMEQAKPYLDKHPEVKELVQNNQDILKQENASALFKQVKSAVESGDTAKLKEYVKNAVDKAKSSAGKGASSIMGNSSLAGLGQFLGVSSEEAAEKVQKDISIMTEVINSQSSEAKKLLEETREDLKRVLEDKAKKARKIMENAEKVQ